MEHLYHKANTEMEHLLLLSMTVLKAHVFAALSTRQSASVAVSTEVPIYHEHNTVLNT